MDRHGSLHALIVALLITLAAAGAAGWLDALRVSAGAVPEPDWGEIASLALRGGIALGWPTGASMVIAWLVAAISRSNRFLSPGRLALSVLAGWSVALALLILVSFSIKVGWIAGAILLGCGAGFLAGRILPGGSGAEGERSGRRSGLLPAAAAVLIWACMLVPAFLAGDPSAGPGPAGARPNVLLIVIDALRADHLGAYGYGRPTSPNIDRLATSGILYREAIAPSSWTLPAMGSVMTGLPPGRHGAVDRGERLAPEIRTLPERMREAGYRTAGLAPNPWLKGAFGFDQGFEEYWDIDRLGLSRRLLGVRLKNFALRRLGRIRVDPELVAPGEDLTDRALSWAGLDGRKPFFLLVHYMDVHSPYVPPAEYRGRFCTGHDFDLPDHRLESRYRSGRLDPDPDLIDHVVELYDESILATDAAIGRLLSGLERSGLLDRTAVILTADHGEEFHDHGETMHGKNLYQEVLRVPLILKLPGAGGSVAVDRRVSLLDIYPSVLEMAGLPVPEGLEGELLDRSAGEIEAGTRGVGAQLLHREWSWSALLVGKDKVIRRTPQEDPGADGIVEVYDLGSDPWERVNLTGLMADHSERLVTALRGYEEIWGLLGPRERSEDHEMDPDTLRQIKALGYVD